LKAFEAVTTPNPLGGGPAGITVRNTNGVVVIDDQDSQGIFSGEE